MTPPAAPLTDRQADEQAKRLFGELGVAWHHAYAPKGDLRSHLVGVMRDPETGETEYVQERWTVYGMGSDWQQAFANAAARGH